MSRQLDLQMSLTAGVVLQQNLARITSYATDEHDRAEALATENAHLREALQAAEAKALAWERQAIEHRTVSEYYQRMLALVRAGMMPPPPRPGLDKDALTALLKIAHPDRWQTRPATELAHELSVTINQMREGVVS